MELRYQAGNETRIVSIERQGDQYHVAVDGRAYTVDVQNVSPERIAFIVSGQQLSHGKHLEAYIASQDEQRYIAFDANVYTITKVDASQRQRTVTAGENALTAAMPGQIVKVLVKSGDEVKRGQTLIILEAMKMEIRVTAPADGRIDKVLVNSGQIVERGQRLIELVNS